MRLTCAVGCHVRLKIRREFLGLHIGMFLRRMQVVHGCAYSKRRSLYAGYSSLLWCVHSPIAESSDDRACPSVDVGNTKYFHYSRRYFAHADKHTGFSSTHVLYHGNRGCLVLKNRDLPWFNERPTKSNLSADPHVSVLADLRRNRSCGRWVAPCNASSGGLSAQMHIFSQEAYLAQLDSSNPQIAK